MPSQSPSYHGYRFPSEIISHAVWLYHRVVLSFRDVEDLLVSAARSSMNRPVSLRPAVSIVPSSLILLLVSSAAAAQPGSALPGTRELTASGAPLARAQRVVGPPEIDGRVLGDPIWDDVVPVMGFRQTTPNEGQPASERTEVRIVYSDDTLYFGVVCYVTDPDTIIVSDSRRDTPLNETDSFRIVIDTYLDRQNGFVFGTNPAGLEYDGQVINEGQGSGGFGGGGGGRPGSQQGGSGGGFNLNWDGAWQVRASISEIGWTAEFAIPFRTLRYPPGGDQTWGINFQRNIRNRNEESFWAPLPRQFNLYRVSLAGEIQGLQVPSQRNLKLIPYALGEVVRREADTRAKAFGDIGADLKYSVTPSLTLDLTLNTDFAQVEVDEEQINLDRFNLFFPEKRPFFLENAGLFSVGLPGQVEVFFSRRIGIGEDGGQVPIIGGGRLSGKVGNNTNVGLLSMQTDAAQETLTPSNNFTVARVRQDFVNRSNVGAVFVNRQGSGSFAGEQDYNRSYAVDGRLGIGQVSTISGFAAGTQTPDVQGDAHAYDLTGRYDTEQYRVTMGYTEVGPNFNPEVGFYSRRGFRRLTSLVFTTFRPENSLEIHEVRPHVSHNTIWNFETGQQESQFTHIDTHWEWQNGYEVHTGLNIFKEGVLTSFEIFPDVIVPVGTYDHAEAQLVANTNRGAPVSASVYAIFGGFFGGDRVQVRPRASMRVGEAFNAQVSWTYNDVNLPVGSFVANLGRLRLNYSFTTRMFLQALVQYNDRADLWSSNIRFGLLSDANTGLFIVYNDTQGLGTARPTGAGRSVTVKYSQLLDLLN